MFKISFTFFYQFSFSQLFSLVEIALPSISFVETLFAFVSNLWDYFFCKSFVRQKTLLPTFALCWSARKQSAEGKSVVYIFPRNWGSGSWPKCCDQLFKSTKALLGTVPWRRKTHAIMILWCVLINEKTKRWKEVCGLYLSEKGSGSWPKCCDQLFKREFKEAHKSANELSQFVIRLPWVKEQSFWFSCCQGVFFSMVWIGQSQKTPESNVGAFRVAE